MSDIPCVVYIITKLELGGAQKVCLTLFNQCAYHTCLITGKDGPLVNTVINKPNIYLLTSMTREVAMRTIIHEIKNFFSIVRVLREVKKKHIHVIVHTHSTKAGIIGRWAAFLARIPVRIHTVHGYAFNNFQSWPVWFIIYFCELITSFITTQFICVSEHDSVVGRRLFPRFAHRCSIVRAAIDMHPFTQARSLPKSSEVFVFGTTACFKPQKNLFDLLHAFECVYQQYPHVRLEIIGDGYQRPAIKQWLLEHALTHVVTLHGWQENITLIAARWHVFVLTSLWEGLPCAVIEARLLKLPVISYKTGGIPEVIMHGKNGFLHEQKDWRAVACSMSLLVIDQVIYRSLSEFQDDLNEFDNQVMIRRHNEIYQNCSRAIGAIAEKR